MQIDPKLSCTLYSELVVHFVRNIHVSLIQSISVS